MGGLPLANPLHVAGGPDAGIYAAAANPARLFDLAGQEPTLKCDLVDSEHLRHLRRGAGLSHYAITNSLYLLTCQPPYERLLGEDKSPGGNRGGWSFKS